MKPHNYGSTSVVARRDTIDEIQSIPSYSKPYAITSVVSTPPDPCINEFKDLFQTHSIIGAGHFPVGVSDQIFVSSIVRPFPNMWTRCGTTVVGDSSNAYGIHSRLAMATEFFDYWSGSIEYHIKFIKTKFHAGRVRFCFVPGAALNSFDDITPEEANELFNDCWSEVFDLTTTSEIAFSVPFTNANYAATRDGYSGTILGRVENKFVAPDTVSQEVGFMIFHRAGPDFKVSKPVFRVGANKGLFNQNGIADEYWLPAATVPAPPPLTDAEISLINLCPQGPLNDRPVICPPNFVNEECVKISDFVQVGTAKEHIFQRVSITSPTQYKPEIVTPSSMAPITMRSLIPISTPTVVGSHPQPSALTKLISIFHGHHSD
jgi:hypothetical protein